MDKMRIHGMDVMASVRSSGMKSLSDVKYAVLERNGGITVIKADKRR